MLNFHTIEMMECTDLSHRQHMFAKVFISAMLFEKTSIISMNHTQLFLFRVRFNDQCTVHFRDRLALDSTLKG